MHILDELVRAWFDFSNDDEEARGRRSGQVLACWLPIRYPATLVAILTSRRLQLAGHKNLMRFCCMQLQVFNGDPSFKDAERSSKQKTQ